jgi:hypothetical protein
MSYYGVCNYIVPVKSFYAINDMTLNEKKLCNFIPEYKRVGKDKSYSYEEVSRLLEIASDPNFRKIVLNFEELFYILFHLLVNYILCTRSYSKV